MTQKEIYEFMKSCKITRLSWNRNNPTCFYGSNVYIAWHFFAPKHMPDQLNVVLHDEIIDKEKNIDFVISRPNTTNMDVFDKDFLVALFNAEIKK